MALAVLCAASVARSTPPPAAGDLQPLAGRPHVAGSAGTAGASGLPIWTSSFTTAGVTYPYTMVGTSPTVGGTTRVPTVVIPLAFRFDAGATKLAGQIVNGCVDDASGTPVPGSCVALGATLDPADVIGPALVSPVFRPADYPLSADSGVQYADAMQRAQFARFGDWHVELGPVTAVPTQVIDVPRNQGLAHVNRRGVVVGRADVDWVGNRLRSLVRQLGLPASVLPVFLSKDAYLFQGDVNACCFLGFHDAAADAGTRGAATVRTWVYAAWSTPGAFVDPDIADAHTLSHEVIEWVADPFLRNLTPPWFAPGYGCDDTLEVGDPLVGVAFTTALGGRTYHLQDTAFLSWFARQVPSIAVGGRYTYLGTFAGPAAGC